MRGWSLISFMVVALGCAVSAAPAWGASTLVVGAEDDWAPYSSKVDGQPHGFAVDVVREAFKSQGIEVKFVSLPFARCMKDVSQGRLAACFNKVRNRHSEAQFLWHQKPLFTTQSIIYARTDSTESNLSAQSLEGKTVGVTNGYEYGEAFDANTKIKRDAANQDDLGFKKLQARRFEYMVSFEKVADSVFAKDPSLAGKFKRVGVAADAHLYLVFSRKHPDGAKYLERFNAGFEALGKNGSYRSLEVKWL